MGSLEMIWISQYELHQNIFRKSFDSNTKNGANVAAGGPGGSNIIIILSSSSGIKASLPGLVRSVATGEPELTDRVGENAHKGYAHAGAVLWKTRSRDCSAAVTRTPETIVLV